MSAAMKGHAALVQLLVDAGANVDVQDKVQNFSARVDGSDGRDGCELTTTGRLDSSHLGNRGEPHCYSTDADRGES
jgi:hypothetical protein